MIKKYLTVLLSVIISLLVFSVVGFSADDKTNNTLPTEEYEIQENEENQEEIRSEGEIIFDMFSEVMGKFFFITLLGKIFSILFFPLLCVTITLAIISYKNKNKIKKYENMLTSTPYFNGAPTYYNNCQNNTNFQGFSNQQNINPQNNDFNNQGGTML